MLRGLALTLRGNDFVGMVGAVYCAHKYAGHSQRKVRAGDGIHYDATGAVV